MSDTRNLGGDGKYSIKFTGPFPVVDKVGTRAYKIQLPDRWKIQNVFHDMLLRAYSEDQDPARQELIKMRLPTPEAQEDPPATTYDKSIAPPLSRTRSKKKQKPEETESSSGWTSKSGK